MPGGLCIVGAECGGRSRTRLGAFYSPQAWACMGRILNTARQKRYITTPSSFDRRLWPCLRRGIKLNVRRCMEDLTLILEGDDEVLKMEVRRGIAGLPGAEPMQEPEQGGQDDISDIEREGTEGLDLGRFVG
ncbi:hypothetical protein CENSYa_0710 [Cenarchaeum symbiosum A]|uniref:Uncharacterized protein n=1 Tax=Cenarchaeum symbiosum (strain A) TaxID=414004 RepID=A0RVH6_CENSY|nr:hypothetical protein CENSYa_0710 [Cenarchaeum symbiosum A]